MSSQRGKKRDGPRSSGPTVGPNSRSGCVPVFIKWASNLRCLISLPAPAKQSLQQPRLIGGQRRQVSYRDQQPASRTITVSAVGLYTFCRSSRQPEVLNLAFPERPAHAFMASTISRVPARQVQVAFVFASRNEISTLKAGPCCYSKGRHCFCLVRLSLIHI